MECPSSGLTELRPYFLLVTPPPSWSMLPSMLDTVQSILSVPSVIQATLLLPPPFWSMLSGMSDTVVSIFCVPSVIQATLFLSL